MATRATREAYGETLIELVEEGLDIVAVDADLASSTTLAAFGKAYPERLFDVGIAEQDMMGVAAGLSLTGKVAFTASFAVFGTGRCYDQIRNTVADSQLNVKICPTHAGITVGEDGASHQMLEDLTLMRVIPHMTVLVPADYQAAKTAIRLAATTPGPVYVRLGRHKVPEVYTDGFSGGVPYAAVVREGSDISLFACGVELAQALAAADLLAQKGISAEVVDVFSIKPLDEEVILKSAAKTKHVLSCEEHMIIGGMGSSIAELLARELPTPQAFVGMNSFGASANGDVLLEHFGLDAKGIAKAAEKLLTTQ